MKQELIKWMEQMILFSQNRLRELNRALKDKPDHPVLVSHKKEMEAILKQEKSKLNIVKTHLSSRPDEPLSEADNKHIKGIKNIIELAKSKPVLEL